VRQPAFTTHYTHERDAKSHQSRSWMTTQPVRYSVLLIESSLLSFNWIVAYIWSIQNKRPSCSLQSAGCNKTPLEPAVLCPVSIVQIRQLQNYSAGTTGLNWSVGEPSASLLPRVAVIGSWEMSGATIRHEGQGTRRRKLLTFN
jgi:hypothetical protein